MTEPQRAVQAQNINTDAAAETRLYSILLALESGARQQKTTDALTFQIVNETHRLLRYFQCFMWQPGVTGRARIDAVSGVSEVDRHAPVVVAMGNIVDALRSREDANTLFSVRPEDLEDKVAEDWRQWFPEFGLWCPMLDKHDKVFGGYFLTREQEFHPSEIRATTLATDAYAHAWRALNPEAGNKGFLRILAGRLMRWSIAALVAAAMFLPVKQSVLAPSEIVPFEPTFVSAPVDGVISEFLVAPNSTVEAGQTLFTFDDTETRSKLALAESGLQVAIADYRRATNKSFHDQRSKAERETFKLRVEEKQLERNYAVQNLQKTVVTANRNGVVVFNDVNDWIGKPVKVGEKILTIAQSNDTEVEIWVPVEDGTNLDKGAKVEIFLNINPAKPIQAVVRQTSYKPTESPAGELGFKLKAKLVDKANDARLGLKGTAKVYGERVSLFYFLFRRPWSVFRQKFGI